LTYTLVLLFLVLLSLTDAVEKVFSGKRMTFFFAAEAPRV
jgi:hypothetical protein